MSKTENTCPVPQGILLVIGGKEDKDGEQQKEKQPASFVPEEILCVFVDLIKKEKPVIELLTSGSEEAEETLKDYQKALSKITEVKLGHLHHNTRAEVFAEDLVARVDNADAIFISGGDQLKLTSLYGGTEFLTRLKQRYIDDKIVIAGTSAGAMAMSTPMIYAGNDEVQDIAGAIKVTTGLEFLKDICIDTHFQNRGRFIRLAQVIATNPTCIGIGLSEDTAVIVREGQQMEVIGSGMATIIEGFHVTDANYQSFTEDLLVSIRDLKVHLISKGDKYEIQHNNPPHM